MLSMPWGKHRGEPIEEIDSSYLCWCLDNADRLSRELRAAILTELQARFARPHPGRPRRRDCNRVPIRSSLAISSPPVAVY